MLLGNVRTADVSYLTALLSLGWKSCLVLSSVADPANATSSRPPGGFARYDAPSPTVTWPFHPAAVSDRTRFRR